MSTAVVMLINNTRVLTYIRLRTGAVRHVSRRKLCREPVRLEPFGRVEVSDVVVDSVHGHGDQRAWFQRDLVHGARVGHGIRFGRQPAYHGYQWIFPQGFCEQTKSENSVSTLDKADGGEREFGSSVEKLKE